MFGSRHICSSIHSIMARAKLMSSMSREAPTPQHEPALKEQALPGESAPPERQHSSSQPTSGQQVSVSSGAVPKGSAPIHLYLSIISSSPTSSFWYHGDSL